MRKKLELRTEQIPIRFSPKERERVEQLAAIQHDYPSTFLRRLILNQIEPGRQPMGSEVL